MQRGEISGPSSTDRQRSKVVAEGNEAYSNTASSMIVIVIKNRHCSTWDKPISAWSPPADFEGRGC